MGGWVRILAVAVLTMLVVDMEKRLSHRS